MEKEKWKCVSFFFVAKYENVLVDTDTLQKSDWLAAPILSVVRQINYIITSSSSSLTFSISYLQNK